MYIFRERNNNIDKYEIFTIAYSYFVPLSFSSLHHHHLDIFELNKK